MRTVDTRAGIVQFELFLNTILFRAENLLIIDRAVNNFQNVNSHLDKK